jgi:hypothetical protein
MTITAIISTAGLNWLKPTASARLYHNLPSKKLITIGKEKSNPMGNPNNNWYASVAW